MHLNHSSKSYYEGVTSKYFLFKSLYVEYNIHSVALRLFAVLTFIQQNALKF